MSCDAAKARISCTGVSLCWGNEGGCEMRAPSLRRMVWSYCHPARWIAARRVSSPSLNETRRVRTSYSPARSARHRIARRDSDKWKCDSRLRTGKLTPGGARGHCPFSCRGSFSGFARTNPAASRCNRRDFRRNWARPPCRRLSAITCIPGLPLVLVLHHHDRPRSSLGWSGAIAGADAVAVEALAHREAEWARDERP